MKVGFGCDHVAIELKNILKEHLEEKGYECVDYGAYDPNVKVNYPEPGLKVAEAIMRGEVEKGVLVFPWLLTRFPGSVQLCAANHIPQSLQ